MAVIPVLSGLANRIRGMRKRARGGGRHNLWCMFIDAAGYPLAFSLISPQTVMPLYLSQLGASAFIVGLIATIDSLGLYVPQLVGAQWCDRLPVKKLYVVAVGMIERAGILGLAIATWLVGMDRPDLLIPLFFLCFGINRVATGLNFPAYHALLAKTVPVDQRGRLFGLGGAVGGLLAIIGARWVGVLLALYDARYAYTMLFGTSFVILVATIVPLGFVHEREETPPAKCSTLQYLRQAPAVFRVDGALRWYGLCQALFALASVVGAFLTVHAVQSLHATPGDVAVFTAVVMFTSALANTVMGVRADRRGYKSLMLFGMLTTSAAALMAALAPNLAFMYGAFALNTLGQVGVGLGMWNLVLELAPKGQAAAYTALTATVTGPFRILAPVVAGLAAGSLGLPAVFGFAALAGLLAGAVLARRIPEPRRPISR